MGILPFCFQVHAAPEDRCRFNRSKANLTELRMRSNDFAS